MCRQLKSASSLCFAVIFQCCANAQSDSETQRQYQEQQRQSQERQREEQRRNDEQRNHEMLLQDLERTRQRHAQTNSGSNTAPTGNSSELGNVLALTIGLTLLDRLLSSKNQNSTVQPSHNQPMNWLCIGFPRLGVPRSFKYSWEGDPQVRTAYLSPSKYGGRYEMLSHPTSATLLVQLQSDPDQFGEDKRVYAVSARSAVAPRTCRSIPSYTWGFTSTGTGQMMVDMFAR